MKSSEVFGDMSSGSEDEEILSVNGDEGGAEKESKEGEKPEQDNDEKDSDKDKDSDAEVERPMEVKHTIWFMVYASRCHLKIFKGSRN